MTKRRVLFVAYGAGHIRTVLPIVQAILDDPQSGMEPVLLALTTAASEARAAGVPCIGFADFGDLEPEIEAWGRKLVGPAPENPVVSYRESVAYHGRSYADLIEIEGEERAAELYEQKGRAAFLPIPTALRVLDQLGIDAVVATNSPRAERAFLEAARLTGRPSLAIWSSLASHEIAWIGQPGFTSKVCVDSPYAIDQMMRSGRPTDEIVLTGNPQFDRLRRPRQAEEIEAFRAAYGWKPDEKILLFAQQNEPAVHPFTGEAGDSGLPQALNDALCSALLRSNEPVNLCVRYHPNQVPLALPDDPRISLSPQSENLDALLHAVDAVFTCSSTVAYQGAIIGKPTVQGLFSVFSKDVPFGAMVGARTVSDFAEMDAVWSELGQGLLPSSTLSMSGSDSAAHNVMNVLKEVLA